MALSDKDIVITPNKGQTSDPQVVFSGASASLGPQNITLRVYPNDNGSLSFEGSSGQLFSITNSLAGIIFSVNDVSGIPSIEVIDTGLVKIGQYTGNVLVGTGTDNATDKFQVTGSIAIDNLRLDGNTLSSIDTNGNIVLAPNGTGDVQLDADTVRIGDANANATLTTNGTGDLILNTNAGTNSSSITIFDAANGNIDLTPNGTGRTNVTNLTTTSPRIVTSINDTNGNELFLLTATTSAVNELTIANAATGNAPAISATGGDTNIGITLTPKGTGVVTVSSALAVSGTTRAAGQFYAGTTDPTNTNRLNFDGYLYATRFYGDGSQLTGIAIPSAQTAGSSTVGYLRYSGNTVTSGQLNGSSTAPSFGTRLNYEGVFYATGLYSPTLNDIKIGLGAGSIADNLAIGDSNTLPVNTTGNGNVAIGTYSMFKNTEGYGNIAIGTFSLYENLIGYGNTAVGYYALKTTTGNINTAFGYQALTATTDGSLNTGIGTQALMGNTSGLQNTGVGCNVLQANTTGNYNTAVGSSAILNTTTGGNNTAVGRSALSSNVLGSHNTVIGHGALSSAGGTVNATAMISGVTYTIRTLGTTDFTLVGAASNTVGTSFTATGVGTGTGTVNHAPLYNTIIGSNAGTSIISGSYNTIVGGYTGNQGGLDIRNQSGHVVLSDGYGNPRIIVNSSGNIGMGITSPTSRLHISGDVTITGNYYGSGSNLTGVVTLSVSEVATVTSPMTWNSDSFTTFVITGQTTALTINADSGSPTTGKRVTFRIRDDGTARALTWSSGTKGFRAIGVTLPTTTVANKITYVGAIYNATDSLWDVIAVVTQA